jgi:hypothetical protein
MPTKAGTMQKKIAAEEVQTAIKNAANLAVSGLLHHCLSHLQPSAAPIQEPS